MDTRILGRAAWARRTLALLALLAALAPLALPATPAHAGPSVVVDTTADTHDANPGDGICADAGGFCSLRAAAEENNAAYGKMSVSVPAGTYVLTEPLDIYDSINIHGAGADQTFIDGDHGTRLLHVRTAELLICDADDSSIASYQYTGQVNKDFAPAGTADLAGPSAVTLGEDGDVYVVANSGVHRFTDDAVDLGLLVDPSLPPLAGWAPSDGIVEPSETGYDLYIADYFPNNRILRADLDTGSVATWVDSGVGGLAQPNDLVFYKDDLYVTNASSHQVLRYSGETGALVSVFVDGYLNTPRGLHFRGGELYVADEGSDSVLVFDADSGDYKGVFVAAGSGGLDKPTDIDFGPDGDLYVVSRNTNNILRYDGETGAFLGVFVAGGNEYLGSPTCLTWRVDGNGPNLNLSRVTLRNGRSLSGDYAAGMTIDRGAQAMLQYVTVRDNASSILGGGIQNWGTLYLHASQVVGNVLPTSGGGMTASGGGIFNGGDLTIWHSLIAGNQAVRGGGIANQGVVNMTNTTISGNRVRGGAGGIRNAGGGILNISSSTISNNHANDVTLNGDPDNDPYGGGIFNVEPAKVFLSNTILAGNTDSRTRYDADYSPDCYSPSLGFLISNRDNLFGILSANCVPQDTSFDLVGTPEMPLDPGLHPLSYNGGPTATHKLRSDSPAVDADLNQIGLAFFDCQKTDQRFKPRPSGRQCDIGAFELIRGIGGDEPPGGLVGR